MTVLLFETPDKRILQNAFDFVANDLPPEVDPARLAAIRSKYKV